MVYNFADRGGKRAEAADGGRARRRGGGRRRVAGLLSGKDVGLMKAPRVDAADEDGIRSFPDVIYAIDVRS